MTNYCARFIQGYSTISQPLRELTQKNTQWEWSTKHRQAFETLKEALANAPQTSYFDPNKETELVVDASPVGLGAILTQIDAQSGQTLIIAYASRSLTDVEQRYSQTEREALAVVWACEYFHLYVYGKPFLVVTDHKPLVPIYSNPASKPPARIERWTLRLQPYQLTVVYRKGKENPADYMSRHPPAYTHARSRHEKIAEEFVDHITLLASPKALPLEEIEKATLNDPTLQAVSVALQSSWHRASQCPGIKTTAFKAFERVKDELTVGANHSVILKGTKIVIPEKFHSRVVDLAHEGHQGIVKTKALIREKVWFPGIDKAVEDKVKSCLACQVSTPRTMREPLQMSPLPEYPWQEVSVDFKDLDTGHLLVIYDDYSRFPVVEVTTSTSANVVVPRLNKVFSEYGIPEVVRSDNGPPFNSERFRQFADDLGFHHRKVTPLWPRANGEVERFMRTIKKTINTARVENKPWKDELCKLLRNYRATPHSSTGVSPAAALFNRNVRVKIPQVNTPVEAPHFRERDEKAKDKMKTTADKSHAKPPILKVGDTVLVKRDPSKKSSDTPYLPDPYVIQRKNGSLVTASNPYRQVTRNSSFFKVIQPETPETNSDPNEDEEIPAEPTQEAPGSSYQEAQNTCTPKRNPARRRNPPQYLTDFVC